MFTGIVEGTGKVVSYKGGKKGGRFVISCNIPLRGMKIGDSISVDGCCLTVIKQSGKKLTFDVSDETVRKTIIRSYKKGTIVNLERPLKPSGHLGGHFVLGHVDGVGKITTVKRSAGSLVVEISYPKRMAPWLIEKGSVAVDGISLTASLSGRLKFKVYIIPHTENVTNLLSKKAGDLVNLEGDVLGKYVERLISLKSLQ